MKIETVSVDSVMVYIGEIISEVVLDELQSAYISLKALDYIIDLTPSYTSILVQYDIFHYDSDSIKEIIIKQLCEQNIKHAIKQGKLIEIPVDYSQGLDLQRVADYHGISCEEVIAKHIGKTYRVYAIGFMEGFAYLGKVDDTIITPRLDSPRKKIPKGSVAIAEVQTAIYPLDSPGGWNILGVTDFDDFALFEVGDRVRFLDVRI